MNRVIASLFVCVSAVLVAGCAKGGDPPLLLAIKNTTPVFQATQSATTTAGALRQGLTWDMGNGYWRIFNLMRDFNHATDEGRIDMTNMYKILFEVGGMLDKAPLKCTRRADGAVPSPFDFGADLLSDTYDCGGNDKSEDPPYGYSYAYKLDGARKELLGGYRWAPRSDQTTLGVIQVHWDTATDDVKLNLAQRVQYTGGDGFGLRTHIVGNAGTHAFTLRSLTGDAANAMVGKGVSRGEGNYFLFKLKLRDFTTGRDIPKYYCIAATATETELRAATVDGSDTVDANCAAYKADVDALAPHTTAPSSLDEFKGAGGGIYLY